MHERDLSDSEDHHERARRLLAHYGATKTNKYQQLGSILTCYRPIMTSSSISLRGGYLGRCVRMGE